MLNASDYNVPQDRKRVFFIGIRKDLNFKYQFPTETFPKITLESTISDLKEGVLPALEYNNTNGENCILPNHEYMIGSFSSIFRTLDLEAVLGRRDVATWQISGQSDTPTTSIS